MILPLKCKIELPKSDEPGSFGAIRKHDIHTGVDLYCNEEEPVYAMEDSDIVNISLFTGTIAGSTWWNDTHFILLKGKSGAILYGELTVNDKIRDSKSIKEGDLLGWVKTVLKEYKGKPMSMLHIELYQEDYYGDGVIWNLNEFQPSILRDITFILKTLIQRK